LAFLLPEVDPNVLGVLSDLESLDSVALGVEEEHTVVQHQTQLQFAALGKLLAVLERQVLITLGLQNPFFIQLHLCKLTRKVTSGFFQQDLFFWHHD